MGSAKIPVLKRRRKSPDKRDFHVVAIGTSAGGLFALSEVLKRLPQALSSSVVIVQHLSPTHKSSLVQLLARTTMMNVKEASDETILEPGTVYIAPPDMHLVSLDKRLRLTHTAALNFHRPSIDTMFESMADSYGTKLIAVILSGSGSDGSAGIAAVKRAGGTTIAQDPLEAEFVSMPKSAIATGCIDRVLRLSEIGPVIQSLCSQ